MSSFIPKRWNVLEAERDFDAQFFERSPYRSLTFLTSTVTLSLDFGIAILVGTMLWSRMPLEIKGVYGLFVVGLPIVWARMLRDHSKMREWYAKATPESRNEYPVRMASHLMTFAPYYLHFLVFIILLFFAGTLRREARLGSIPSVQAQTVGQQQTK